MLLRHNWYGGVIHTHGVNVCVCVVFKLIKRTPSSSKRETWRRAFLVGGADTSSAIAPARNAAMIQCLLAPKLLGQEPRKLEFGLEAFKEFIALVT